MNSRPVWTTRETLSQKTKPNQNKTKQTSESLATEVNTSYLCLRLAGQTHLKGLLNNINRPYPRLSNSLGLGCDQRIASSNEFPGDMMPPIGDHIVPKDTRKKAGTWKAFTPGFIIEDQQGR